MRYNADAGGTYKLLDDGSWGVWLDIEYSKGKTVTVTTKGGQTRAEKLKELIWTDGKLWLWRVEER